MTLRLEMFLLSLLVVTCYMIVFGDPRPLLAIEVGDPKRARCRTQ
jgi:hypothetical protein